MAQAYYSIDNTGQRINEILKKGADGEFNIAQADIEALKIQTSNLLQFTNNKFNSIKYYGDINIAPTNADYFIFTKSINNAAFLTRVAVQSSELTGDIVIPYEYVEDGVSYPVIGIENGVFDTYRNITSIIIPNSIATIDIGVFAGCENITSIILPKSVISIGEHTFYGCDSLTDIYYTGTETEWNAISGINYTDIPDTTVVHFNYVPAMKSDIDDKLKNYLKEPISGAAIGKYFRVASVNAEGHPILEYVDIPSIPTEAADLPYDNTDTQLTATNTQAAIDEIYSLTLTKLTSWTQIQDIIRRGLASTYFNVGDSFEVTKGQSTLLFDIIGFDQDIPTTSQSEVLIGENITHITVDYFAFLAQTGSAGNFEFIYANNKWKNKIGEVVTLSQYGIEITGTPSEGDSFIVSIPHTMTLQLHDTSLTEKITFDAPEATWYLNSTDFPTGLASGTYYFTTPQGNAYHFTLNSAVPTEGVLRYNPDDGKVYAYSTVGKSASDESVSVTTGEEGAMLPSIPDTAINSVVNGYRQSRYGLNDWAQSSIRQWLNTRGAAGEWWEPQNPFDRPSNSSKAGFLNNVDMDFINAVGTVYKKTKRNAALGGNIEVIPERFFLLAYSEVYGGTSVGIEGEPYAYYGEGSSSLPGPSTSDDSNRIITSAGTAKTWWLRTPNSTNVTIYAFNVNTTGGISASTAYNGAAAAPACVIY